MIKHRMTWEHRAIATNGMSYHVYCVVYHRRCYGNTTRECELEQCIARHLLRCGTLSLRFSFGGNVWGIGGMVLLIPKDIENFIQ